MSTHCINIFGPPNDNLVTVGCCYPVPRVSLCLSNFLDLDLYGSECRRASGSLIHRSLLMHNRMAPYHSPSYCFGPHTAFWCATRHAGSSLHRATWNVTHLFSLDFTEVEMRSTSGLVKKGNYGGLYWTKLTMQQVRGRI